MNTIYANLSVWERIFLDFVFLCKSVCMLFVALKMYLVSVVMVSFLSTGNRQNVGGVHVAV